MHLKKYRFLLPWIIAISFQVILILLAAIFLLKSSGSDFSFELIKKRLGAWDGGHYIYLAQNGYVTHSDKFNLIVFLPLYPFLIKIFSLEFFSPHLAALIISSTSSIIGISLLIIYLHKRLRFPKWKIARVALLFFFSPIGIYFAIAYTEGLYFALIIAFFYCLSKEKLLFASLLVTLASLTKLQGILLIIPLGYYLTKGYFKTPNKSTAAKALVYLSVASIGVLIYLFINQSIYDNPFFFKERMEGYWVKQLSNPVFTYANFFKYTVNFIKGGQVDLIIVDFIFALAAPMVIAAYLILGKKKIPPEMILWTIANVILIISQSWWLSSARYISILFPLTIMIESLAWKIKPVYFILLVCFFWLFIKGAIGFSLGDWVY